MNKIARNFSVLLVSLLATGAAVLVYQHNQAPRATYAALETSPAGISFGP